MTQHTPGPWVAHLHHAADFGGRTHAMIAAKGSIIPLGAVVLGVEGVDQQEGRANANLIAAAPDMLAAIRTTQCHRPANTAPDDTTVERCCERGECGCDLGVAFKRATAR